MYRSFSCFAALLLVCSALRAQNDFFAIRNYNVSDGLPQSQVKAIVEDRNGYLWIGTESGGLARFDGREFKVYTTLDGLLSNEVISLHFDSRQNLWILHPRGATRYDGLTFTTYQKPQEQGKGGSLRAMCVLNDTIFALSGNGYVSKIYRDSTYYWDKVNGEGLRIFGFLTGPEGEILMMQSDSTLLVRSGSDSYRIPFPVSIRKLYCGFNYKGNVVAQTMEGQYLVDFTNLTIRKTHIPVEHMVLRYEEKTGIFWQTNGNTLFRSQWVNGVMVTDTVLHDTDVRQVFTDAEGNVWFASNGSGLFKYYMQDFRRWGPPEIRSVMSIARDRHGDMWLTTISRGLWRIRNGKATPYLNNDKTRNMITCVHASPSGDIWLGTLDGVGRYNPSRDDFDWFGISDGLPGRSISSLAFDDKGMWVGTGNGLAYFDGQTFTTVRLDGLSQGHISAMKYRPEGNVLFLGFDTEVKAIHNGKVLPIAIPEIRNTRVLSLSLYQDSLLLVGTGGAGVVMYNVNTRAYRLLTTRDGLASDFVFFVASDEEARIWVGTEKGINLLTFNDGREVVGNVHYDDDNGLVGVETNQNAYYFDGDEKYFGLVDGVYLYNKFGRAGLRSFGVHLTDVKILYGEYSSRNYADSTFGFYKIPYAPVFPSDKNHITFQFNRVDKRYSKSARFRYYLENFDKTWSQPTTVGQVTYSNLPPGKYVFRVMSTTSRGSWATARVAYPFTIEAPFYQTTAFIIAAVLGAGALVTLALYLRFRQKVNRIVMLERVRQREQDLLRKEIARDFHDEMGNQLTRIINYVSLLRLNGNGYNGTASNGSDLYTKVEDSAKYLYTGTHDFIWSIDPVNDELSKLFIHVRDFGEKLFEEKQINFRAFNEVRETIRLPYGFSRQANLIFKEAMTNAFKYSCAKNVSFSLQQTGPDAFAFSLEDDGDGFCMDGIQPSGLQNIRDRANKIHADLRIQSDTGRGTRIQLKFTIKKTTRYDTPFQKARDDR